MAISGLEQPTTGEYRIEAKADNDVTIVRVREGASTVDGLERGSGTYRVDSGRHVRFERAGSRYVPAQVVVFSGPARSPCGPADARTGPYYCMLDRRIYLDLQFFEVLAKAFRAPGDFAQAYVLAHEVGHHVQNLVGVSAQAQEFIREGAAPPNLVSIAQELQADCLAGVWAHSTYDRGLLERGDLAEAQRAAAAVGDDRIQKRSTGRVNPETWTHGSASQRREWLTRGFTAGDPGACDTFSRIL